MAEPDPDHPAVHPVVRMGNDIARQFAYLSEGEAAKAVGNHIAMFWDPRMRADLAAEIERDPSQLDPLVVEAVHALSP
jgi:formate dehydrogenase subunit delta